MVGPQIVAQAGRRAQAGEDEQLAVRAVPHRGVGEVGGQRRRVAQQAPDAATGSQVGGTESLQVGPDHRARLAAAEQLHHPTPFAVRRAHLRHGPPGPSHLQRAARRTQPPLSRVTVCPGDGSAGPHGWPCAPATQSEACSVWTPSPVPGPSPRAGP